MLIALLATAAISGVQSAPPSDRTCLDDTNRDICAPATRAALLERLGMATAEADAAAGVESYRVFFVDGYGNDLPAFVFERRAGAGPMSVVYGAEDKRLEAPVSLALWNEVVARAEFADRELVAPPADPNGPPGLCLHAWSSTVEMTNSPRTRRRSEPVRRRTENACNGALTTRFAFFLAEQTLKAQPHCQALNPDRQRNTVTLVATCMGLSGDRVAAGAVFDQIRDGQPRQGLDLDNPYAWQAYLGTNGSPRLDWAGQVVVGRQGRDRNVAEFIIARRQERPSLRFYPRTFDGIDARRVVVEGQARYSDEAAGGEESWFAADFTQTWVWDPNLSEWMVSDWVVQPFVPVP